MMVSPLFMFYTETYDKPESSGAAYHFVMHIKLVMFFVAKNTWLLL